MKTELVYKLNDTFLIAPNPKGSKKVKIQFSFKNCLIVLSEFICFHLSMLSTLRSHFLLPIGSEQIRNEFIKPIQIEGFVNHCALESLWQKKET